MTCKSWNAEWIAQLYGELEPEAERRAVEHLEQCGECAARLAGLDEARRLLHESAPVVPALLVPPRRMPPRPWSGAFVAGMAAAGLIFALGVWAAPRLSRPSDGDLAGSLLTRGEVRQELGRLEQRIGRERARELEFLLRSMTDVEVRTGSWMDQTSEAIQLLALRQDPRIREH